VLGESFHFRGGVEFHGAGAKWDHAVCEGEIFGLQEVDIAK